MKASPVTAVAAGYLAGMLLVIASVMLGVLFSTTPARQCARPVHHGHTTWTECRYSDGRTVTTEVTTR